MNTFEKINSEVLEYRHQNTEDLLTKIKTYAFIVIYNPDGVVLDYANKVEASSINKFTELRAFNSNGELVVRRFGDKFRGRLRVDSVGENTEYLDEAHLLWGEAKDGHLSQEDYTFLSEDRGTQLLVPFDIPKGERAFIKIRNYLMSTEQIPHHRLYPAEAI